MKGPGLRLDLDIRRLWKCPQTGETIRLSGNTVAKSIQVEGETVFLKLVEEKRKLYRDPYHFDYAETMAVDQSSSERAAAAARSIDETEPASESPTEPAPEQNSSEPQTPEAVPDTLEQSKPDTSPNDNNGEEQDDDSFGGGLL